MDLMIIVIAAVATVLIFGVGFVCGAGWAGLGHKNRSLDRAVRQMRQEENQCDG